MSNPNRQLGIHLTEHSIRIIEAVDNGRKVANFGHIPLPRTFTEMRKDTKSEELSQAITHALSKTKP